jgi:hypothetical protein
MSISTIALRITRTAHKFAVSAHCSALRLSVAAARAKASIKSTEASIAIAAATAARQIAADADAAYPVVVSMGLITTSALVTLLLIKLL